MKKNIVLLFSNFDLPESNANAIRVFNFAKMLREHNFEPIIYGVTYCNKELEGVFEELRYKLIKLPRSNGLMSIFRVIKMKKLISDELKIINKKFKVDAIILSNIYFDSSKVFINFSKKNKVPIIVNSVEWYDKNNNQFKGLYGPIKFIKNRIALKHIHVKMKNIIAISTLLEEYYKSKKCNVITIPTVVDLKHYETINKMHKLDNKIKLCYAGSPAKKDLIINFVYALLDMDKSVSKNFELNLYGFDLDALYKYGLKSNEVEDLKGIVKCHGRIPYSEVKKKIAESDFTILVRPQKRYANAGFPTKVGESFACGTPVISNITSDLGKYLIDMKNSIICKDETVESCKQALLKTLEIETKEYSKMRMDAYKTASDFFSYHVYSMLLYDFINKIKK